MKIPFPRLERRSSAFVHDVTMAALSFALALYLRLGTFDYPSISPEDMLYSGLLFTATCAVVFMASGLYRSIWAFASIRDLKEILRAVTLSVVIYIIVGFVFTRLTGVPRTVPFITWFIMLAGLGGSRMAFRVLRERRLSALWLRSGGGRVKVLVVGAGDETDLFIRAIANNPHAPYKVVGVIGENSKRVGRRIHGIEVLGTIDELPEIMRELRARDAAPSKLILPRSFARLNGRLVDQLLEQAPALGLSLSRLPALTELRDDVTSISSVKDQPIALEDLLGRPEIVLNREEISKLIAGRRVLVTGAGGSIGSELVRQIAALKPQHLSLIELSEFNLYKIEMEVTEGFPDISKRAIIADVRDSNRLVQVFREERPDIVFHAAAIKHVPLAEDNAREAILTNVIGTRLVADCAAKSGVMAVVQISTDKAVNPTNVMGATKRLAEKYCQALDVNSQQTRFMTVRFGNVLGSTGSVVPRFQEQLSNGGPITVTHPDITRYFMTIREAVELVLQASAFGLRPGEVRGKILVLDMGNPVKITDLARQMIRLAGMKPGEDIKIVYTGLRPGEKLYEELFSSEEEIMPSAADGVQLAKSKVGDLAHIQHEIGNFAIQLQSGMADNNAIERLKELVPEFNHA